MRRKSAKKQPAAAALPDAAPAARRWHEDASLVDSLYNDYDYISIVFLVILVT